jgi:nitronate monooxygenase
MDFRQLFGTDLPVIQAPMAGVQGSALTAAVCRAGGLGSLPCALLTPDALREEITTIRAQTDRPFSVNFFCHRPPAPDPDREAGWRAALAPYYAELGIEPESAPPGGALPPFGREVAAVLAELSPPVVSFHFGLPSDELLQPIRASGARILSSATTVEEARWLESRGVDAVIAQGIEAGGHRGMFLSNELTTQIGTLALVPQVVRAVRVPVIAAGGVGSAEAVAAAIALGASGVQVGTAYLLCPEAMTSGVHRAALASDAARHTALTNVFTGRPARSIVNRIVRELGPMHPAAPAFPLAAGALVPLRAVAESRGSDDFSPLWAGQNASACREVSASELTRMLAARL